MFINRIHASALGKRIVRIQVSPFSLSFLDQSRSALKPAHEAPAAQRERLWLLVQFYCRVCMNFTAWVSQYGFSKIEAATSVP